VAADVHESVKTEPPEETAPRRRLAWWRIALLIVLGVVLASLLAFGIFIALFITHYGDPAPKRAMPVENQTNMTLTIYAIVWVAGPASHKQVKEVPLAEIPPLGTESMPGSCDNAELVARNQRGDEVARHEPTRVCDPESWVPWVIS
jgi:hypothetical protein